MGWFYEEFFKNGSYARHLHFYYIHSSPSQSHTFNVLCQMSVILMVKICETYKNYFPNNNISDCLKILEFVFKFLQIFTKGIQIALACKLQVYDTVENCTKSLFVFIAKIMFASVILNLMQLKLTVLMKYKKQEIQIIFIILWQ